MGEKMSFLGKVGFTAILEYYNFYIEDTFTLIFLPVFIRF